MMGLQLLRWGFPIPEGYTEEQNRIDTERKFKNESRSNMATGQQICFEAQGLNIA